jgi:hypothetical protein
MRSSSVLGRAAAAACLCVAAACGGSSAPSSPSNPSTPTTVTPVLTTISVSLSASSVTVGQTSTATASGADQAGQSIATGSVTLSVGNTAVVTVNASGVVTGVAPGQTTVIASAGGKQGQTAITVTAPVPVRASTDRADELSGSQVHFIYAVPSGGTDRQLDLTGAIQNSVGSWQTWLGGQTGGRKMRVDTHQSLLDITYVALPRTDAVYVSYGTNIRDSIEADLKRLDQANAAGKIYEAYYEGGNTTACASAAWPPQLAGVVGVIYLKGLASGPVPCANNALASSPTAAPGYMEFAAIHELLHLLGVVSTTAPNHTLSGHVSTSPSDLMYAGSQPWTPSTLDANKQNYYNPAGLPAGVFNLANSPYLASAAATALARSPAR